MVDFSGKNDTPAPVVKLLVPYNSTTFPIRSMRKRLIPYFGIQTVSGRQFNRILPGEILLLLRLDRFLSKLPTLACRVHAIYYSRNSASRHERPRFFTSLLIT